MLCVPDDDKVWFDRYIEKKFKHSPNTAKSVKSAIKYFYEHVGKSIKDLTFDDIDAYLDDIDASPLKRSSKVQYISGVRKYIAMTTYELNRRGEHIIDLFPPEIDLRIENDDVREDVEGTESIIPDEMLEQIIMLARERSVKEHIFFLLLKYCGMRVSECLSIKVKNLHLDERYLVTGVVYGCRKNNKDGKNPSVYFFPRKVVTEINQYMKLLEKNTEWLFPMKSDKSRHEGHNHYADIYSGLVGYDFTSHAFRRTLITKRKNMGCDMATSHMLVNHAISDVEFQHYIKLSVAEKRAAYDSWNPYQ